MDEEIKPCPFCGCEAIMASPRGDVTHWMVYCPYSDFNANAYRLSYKTNPNTRHSARAYGSTRQEAIDSWNRRA